MLPLGHIAGIPVEETALSFGPVLLASGGILSLKMREKLARRRKRPTARIPSPPDKSAWERSTDNSGG
jgi:hypothetical protein